MTNTPKGYNCETCGKFHEYPMYVYAHIRDVLNHICDECGARHSIVLLSAKQTKKGKVKKSKPAGGTRAAASITNEKDSA